MNILIVEDEELNELLPVCLSEDSVETAQNLRDAKGLLATFWPELVVLDAIFPAFPCANPEMHTAFNAGAFLEALADKQPKGKRLPDVILISGATEAAEHFREIAAWLKDGTLYDVIPKAGFRWEFFRNVLGHKIDGLRRDRPFAPVVSGAKTAFEEMESHGIFTRDPAMLRVWDRIVQHAEPALHKANFYVWGEPGVGKELVAGAVAALKKTNCLGFNCNVYDQTFASEIFGSCPGAYTSAENKAGKIELAKKGVLFLDQFCSVSASLQFQLLRVLEPDCRKYWRLGGLQELTAECKFVIADTLAPEAALRAAPSDEKRLIKEMFSRVEFGGVEVPPLRDRRGDIPLLTSKFLSRFNAEHDKQVNLDAEILDRFSEGRWPGNIRALRGVVESLVSAFSGRVGWDDICRSNDAARVRVQLEELGSSGRSVTVPVALSRWTLGARALESHEADIVARLGSALTSEGAALLASFSTALGERKDGAGRKRNDPGRHLFYAALLFLAEGPSRSAGSRALEESLLIKSGQVHKLCTEFRALLQGPLENLCRCELVNNRYNLAMPDGILQALVRPS